MLNKVPEVILYLLDHQVSLHDDRRDLLGQPHLHLGRREQPQRARPRRRLRQGDAHHDRRARGPAGDSVHPQGLRRVGLLGSIVVISLVGTQITDQFEGNGDQPNNMWAITIVSVTLLALVFLVWWLVERTLSMHSIRTHPPRGLLLAGDPRHLRDRHRGRRSDRGEVQPRLPHHPAAVRGRDRRDRRRSGDSPNINGVLAFWLAYIMTRPLGASTGDFLSQKGNQGLNLGTSVTSYIFLGIIVCLVAFLADQEAGHHSRSSSSTPTRSTTRTCPISTPTRNRLPRKPENLERKAPSRIFHGTRALGGDPFRPLLPGSSRGSAAGMTSAFGGIPRTFHGRFVGRTEEHERFVRGVLVLCQRRRPELTVLPGGVRGVHEKRLRVLDGGQSGLPDGSDDLKDARASGGGAAGELVCRHLRVVRDLGGDALE